MKNQNKHVSNVVYFEVSFASTNQGKATQPQYSVPVVRPQKQVCTCKLLKLNFEVLLFKKSVSYYKQTPIKTNYLQNYQNVLISVRWLEKLDL